MTAKIDQNQADQYEDAGMFNSYEMIPGTFYLPVAENPPTDPVERAAWSPVVGVRAHADIQLRHVNYSATKHGAPPFVPPPKSTGKFALMGATIDVPYPGLNINGGPVWSVEGNYTYVQTSCREEADGFVLGGLPFVLRGQLLGATTVSPSSNAPADVKSSGIGPQTGWVKGNQVNPLDPNYFYSEPTYLPAVFFSDDIVNGASAYQ